MPTNQSSDLVSLVASLQRSFNAKQFSSLPPLLTRAKLLLAASNALTPTANTSPSALHLARTVFEIGAYTSIQLQDQPAFVNYLGYLHNFFALGAGGEREAELTGLNLLRLLAENKIAEFHTTLEILGDSPVKGSEPVRFARGLEEWVMEGAYNRVWKAGEGDGVNDYQKFFLHVLMDTIRNEIATCLERAYPTLPISDCQTLLFFPAQSSVLFKEFAYAREWRIHGSGPKMVVLFPPLAPTSLSPTEEGSMSEIPASMMGVGGLGALYSVGGEKILKVGLGYANELEKVI